MTKEKKIIRAVSRRHNVSKSDLLYYYVITFIINLGYHDMLLLLPQVSHYNYTNAQFLSNWFPKQLKITE